MVTNENEISLIGWIIIVAVVIWVATLGGERAGTVKYDDCRETITLKPDNYQKYYMKFTCDYTLGKCVHVDLNNTWFSSGSSCIKAFIYYKKKRMVMVEINGERGSVPASNVEAMKKDYPSMKVINENEKVSSSSLSSVPKGMVRVEVDGEMHFLPSDKVEAAKKKYPNLKVVSKGLTETRKTLAESSKEVSMVDVELDGTVYEIPSNKINLFKEKYKNAKVLS
jgi:hypothetical protein